MKKIFQSARLYLILGLVAGVFYREFTKFNNFTGTSQLSVLHTHLLALGMLFFLVVLALEKGFTLSTHKDFSKFLNFYNAGLLLTAIMMVVRGTLQVFGTEISKAQDGMISGISGLGHIILTVGLVYLFKILKERVNTEKTA